ncbi:MAG: hypothetical protein AABW58_04420 [Nanoarchaeota archaeon]
MATKKIVSNPERITEIGELEDTLRKIDIYRKRVLKDEDEAGVLKLQNMQLGIIYLVDSEENATREINKEVIAGQTSEWGIKFWRRSYFEERREKLKRQPTNSY